LCEREPEIPWSVSVSEPADTVDADERMIVCAAPGLSVSIEGDAVTPVGSPEIVVTTVR
jgi:hypothetical protein